jgi:hypothetical protein
VSKSFTLTLKMSNSFAIVLPLFMLLIFGLTHSEAYLTALVVP